MADVALDNHEIEQRLGFMKEMEKSPRSKPGSIRRTIAATRSGCKLMRQVSALGMEDPVFRTNERGPEHPSNIFDDMGVNDIPSDMLDMVSIASDHTAAQGDGLDIMLFHMSLTCTQSSIESRGSTQNKRPSLLDANPKALLGVQPRSLLDDRPISPTPCMEDTSNSESIPQGSSFSKENSHLFPALKRKMGIKNPVTATVTQKTSHPPTWRPSGTSPRRPDQRCTLSLKKNIALTKETLNASLPSLDLEAVFGTSRVKGLPSVPRDAPRKRRASSSTHPCKTDALLAEAALAMEEQGSVCHELIETAKCQHASISSPSHTSRRESSSSRRESSVAAIPEDVTNVDVANNEDYPTRRRVMPTISGLFPGTASKGSESSPQVPRRKPESEPAGTKGAAA
jgi:hypothetical protein